MCKRLVALVLVLAVALTMVLAGCGSTSSGSGISKDKIKVGFIYIGPAKDGGWTEAHDNGRKYLEEKLGVTTMYKELVPEGPESAKSIKDLIDQGCNVIFTTSFGYMDPTIEVAKENPNVKFFHCSGSKRADNVSTYFGKIEQPRYLSGIVAGMKTKANKIGYVAAFEIPEVIRGINAFTLGVQSVNPDAKVIVRWSHTWIDAAKEKDVAVALLDEGCDVIAQHNDSTSPQIAAEQRGAFAIGYDLDVPDAAPKAYMTAPIFNWGPYYVDQVQQIMNGTWKSSDSWGGMKDGIVALAPLTKNAPEGAQAKIDEVKKKIDDGSFKIFEGPLKDQTGAVKVEEGKAMTDEEVWNMDWFIQGVEGKIEK
jgi:basic membrane protein A